MISKSRTGFWRVSDPPYVTIIDMTIILHITITFTALGFFTTFTHVDNFVVQIWLSLLGWLQDQPKFAYITLNNIQTTM